MFRQRLVSALLVLPPVLFAIYAGGYIFLILISIATVLALHEFFVISSIKHKSLRIFNYITGVLTLVAAYFYGTAGLFTVLITTFLLLQIMWILIFPFDMRPIMLAFWGQFYIPGLLAFFIILRTYANGFLLVLAVMLAVWASDTGAYLCGITFGRHKLLPAVSPKKSVEGALGGFAAAGAILLPLAPLFGISWFLAYAVGLVISLSGQCGDLAESALKRWADTKDSGMFMPGHGGILDRLDSLLFAAPVSYLIYLLMGMVQR